MDAGDRLDREANQTESTPVTSAIHPTAIVEPGAELGSDVEIGPFSMVGPRVTLGDRVKIWNGVTIRGATYIGDDVEIFPGSVVGTRPQILGLKESNDARIVVGPRTILRENVTIHPGSTNDGETRVGADGLFMVGVHIAHDCVVGDKCVFANTVTLGGHVHVGDEVWMGGLAAIHQFTQIGRHAFVGGGAALTTDVIPFGSVVGNYAHLAGLNIIGLKRRGFSRETIHDLRAAYRLLFADEGTFSERLEDTARSFADSPEVMEIVDFVQRGRERSLCMPK